MDFAPSTEEIALRDTARDLLAKRWSKGAARDALDRGPAFIPEDVWRELCDLGWVGIAVPESAGGGGAGIVTAAVLAEEAGRALLPGPLLSTLAASVAAAWGGAESALLADLAAGRLRATLAVDEPGVGFGPGTVTTVAAAGPGGVTLTGNKALVPDAAESDLILVAAQPAYGAYGATLFVVRRDAPGVDIVPLRRIDGQSLADVHLQDVCAEPLRSSDTGLGAAYDAATVLLAADLLGTACGALDTTVEYARQRVQFGHPIGTFQAVSHRLADACVQVEIARGLVYGAALALDEQRSDAGRLVSAAKAWTSDAAIFTAEAALQVHGGIGYTWEADVHLFLRRARANSVTLGDADQHRDRLAGYLEGGW